MKQTTTNRRTPPNSRNKIEGDIINRLELMLHDRKLEKRTTSKKKASVRSTAAGGNRSSMPSLRAVATSVPQVTAYTIQQTAPSKSVHIERASEQIGSITLIPGQNPGDVSEFLLNPQELPGTRLSAIAQNFQKFKFRAASLTIASNLPTTVGGQLATGYTNQPEQQFTPGPVAPQQVFALPGSAFQSLYTPMTVTAKLDGRNPPLFIDATGRDQNTTIQGKFVISPSQIPSTSGVVTLPVVLNYDCEFSQPAILAPPSVLPQIWPSTRFVSRGMDGRISLDLAVGETVALPSFPTATLQQLNPTLEAELWAGGEPAGDVMLNYVAYTGVSGQFFFYKSVEDFNNGTPILNIGTAAESAGMNQQLMRSTVQAPLN